MESEKPPFESFPDSIFPHRRKTLLASRSLALRRNAAGKLARRRLVCLFARQRVEPDRLLRTVEVFEDLAHFNVSRRFTHDMERDTKQSIGE